MSDETTVVAVLQKTNELLTILAKSALAPVIEKELSDPKKRRLYEMTGGPHPIKEISTRVGMGAGTISRHWQRWEQLGLVLKDGKSYRRIFQ